MTNHFSYQDIGEYRIFYEWKQWEKKIQVGFDKNDKPLMRVIGDYVSVLVMKDGVCLRGEWI